VGHDANGIQVSEGNNYRLYNAKIERLPVGAKFTHLKKLHSTIAKVLKNSWSLRRYYGSFAIQSGREAYASHRYYLGGIDFSSLPPATQASANFHIDFNHIEGEVHHGFAKGGHFYNSPKIRILGIPINIATPDGVNNGVVQAQIEIKDATGAYIPKSNNGGFSTLLPQAWSLDKAKGELTEAWNAKNYIHPTGQYLGISTDGVTFRFFPPSGYVTKWRGYPLH
jgi:hypothetical protein